MVTNASVFVGKYQELLLIIKTIKNKMLGTEWRWSASVLKRKYMNCQTLCITILNEKLQAVLPNWHFLFVFAENKFS